LFYIIIISNYNEGGTYICIYMMAYICIYIYIKIHLIFIYRKFEV